VVLSVFPYPNGGLVMMHHDDDDGLVMDD